MKYFKCLVLGLFLIMLNGCWGQPDVEKVGPVLQLGVETGKNGRLLVTNSFPVFGMANKNQDAIISILADNIRESRELRRKLSAQIPEGGKLQQYLFSAEFAGKGLQPWLEVFERDPQNPPHAKIVIVDGSPKELMEKAALFKDNPRSAIYIQNLLANNRDQYVAVNRIIDFNINYFAPGVDPVTALIKLEKKGIRLTGTAVFAGDRMVGAVNSDQTPLLLAMMGRLHGGRYIFRHPVILPGVDRAKSTAAARIVKMKRKIQTRIRDNRVEITINLKFVGILEEYRWDHMNQLQSKRKLEQSFSMELNQRCNQLIQYLQSAGSDPIGIGDLIRANHYLFWKQNKTGSIYKTARIRIKTKFKISQYGAID